MAIMLAFKINYTLKTNKKNHVTVLYSVKNVSCVREVIGLVVIIPSPVDLFTGHRVLSLG